MLGNNNEDHENQAGIPKHVAGDPMIDSTQIPPCSRSSSSSTEKQPQGEGERRKHASNEMEWLLRKPGTLIEKTSAGRQLLAP